MQRIQLLYAVHRNVVYHIGCVTMFYCPTRDSCAQGTPTVPCVLHVE